MRLRGTAVGCPTAGGRLTGATDGAAAGGCAAGRVGGAVLRCRHNGTGFLVRRKTRTAAGCGVLSGLRPTRVARKERDTAAMRTACSCAGE